MKILGMSIGLTATGSSQTPAPAASGPASAAARPAAPILRLADTAIGVAVGIAAAWIGLRFIRWPSRTEPGPA